MTQPNLETSRLLLRPFTVDDVQTVEALVGDFEVSKYMLHVPYPYPTGRALSWITTHASDFAIGRGAHFAITQKADQFLCGAISLDVKPEHKRAGLGYWLGKDYWGHGYAAEAAKALIEYGFTKLGLNRIAADHFSTNRSSGRVMQKIGMKHEGSLKQHYYKNGEYADSEIYGILLSDWQQMQEG
jgi:[ribosomal protein S5]-alanine N-acetyltransferase